jgi:hypothetical protein
MSVKRSLVQLAVASTFAMMAASAIEAGSNKNIWAHDNLVACVVNHFDAKARGPEDTAQMFNGLGITKLAYNWREVDVPNFDAEIDAMKAHGIEIKAWVLYGSENAHSQLILDTFKRHQIHPQLWIEETGQGKEAADIQTTPDQQKQKIAQEADKIQALAKLSTPYGVKIVLYNHNGWLGMELNQIAVINELKKRGVSDVGMVYNFTHARDKVHDDSKDFASLWPKMRPHVVEVNITGMDVDPHVLYPSQGNGELEMMRIIQRSGWQGPVGITAEKGGDAEVTLKNYIVGVDWLAAEIKKPGSAGPPPFPPAT